MDKVPLRCDACGTELRPVPPPIPPQILNGPLVSSVVIANGVAECSGCSAKYVTQIQGVQFSMIFVAVKEESKIVVPTMVPPDLKRIK